MHYGDYCVRQCTVQWCDASRSRPHTYVSGRYSSRLFFPTFVWAAPTRMPRVYSREYSRTRRSVKGKGLACSFYRIRSESNSQCERNLDSIMHRSNFSVCVRGCKKKWGICRDGLYQWSSISRKIFIIVTWNSHVRFSNLNIELDEFFFYFNCVRYVTLYLQVQLENSKLKSECLI